MLERLQQSIKQGIDAGLHIGAQVHVSRRGEPIADLAIGEAQPGVPMTPEHLVLWLSSCKPTVAIALAQQWEQGRLDLDAPVADYVPTFAQGGKEAITLRHVLTHTGGFRPSRFDYPEDNWDTIIEKICATPIERNWTPGEKAGYHAHSGWFVLGEIIQRVSGEAFSDYMRRHIFEPLGMNDSWIGMPMERYEAYGERIAVLPDTSKQPPEPLGYHKRDWVSRARPSGNGYGPVRELARFYEMLLAGGELDGTRIVEPETAELFTARHRAGLFDHTFQHKMDWGLGFIIDAKRYGAQLVPYGYGPYASDHTFGHSGWQTSAAFADPAHGLAVALMFNGAPGEKVHQRRIDQALAALYEDLGLAGEV